MSNLLEARLDTYIAFINENKHLYRGWVRSACLYSDFPVSPLYLLVEDTLRVYLTTIDFKSAGSYAMDYADLVFLRCGTAIGCGASDAGPKINAALLDATDVLAGYGVLNAYDERLRQMLEDGCISAVMEPLLRGHQHALERCEARRLCGQRVSLGGYRRPPTEDRQRIFAFSAAYPAPAPLVRNAEEAITYAKEVFTRFGKAVSQNAPNEFTKLYMLDDALTFLTAYGALDAFAQFIDKIEEDPSLTYDDINHLLTGHELALMRAETKLNQQRACSAS